MYICLGRRCIRSLQRQHTEPSVGYVDSPGHRPMLFLLRTVPSALDPVLLSQHNSQELDYPEAIPRRSRDFSLRHDDHARSAAHHSPYDGNRGNLSWG
jgi:hypothetical protein